MLSAAVSSGSAALSVTAVETESWLISSLAAAAAAGLLLLLPACYALHTHNSDSLHAQPTNTEQALLLHAYTVTSLIRKPSFLSRLSSLAVRELYTASTAATERLCWLSQPCVRCTCWKSSLTFRSCNCT